MQIEKLTVRNFRCFEHKEVTFHPGFNVLIGDNGTGKTSLLEALKVSFGAYLECFVSSVWHPLFLGFSRNDLRVVTTGTNDLPVIDNVYPVEVRIQGILSGKPFDLIRGITTHDKYESTEDIRAVAEAFKATITQSQPHVLPVFAYYPTHRFWAGKESPEERTNRSGPNENGPLTTDDIGRPIPRFDGYWGAENAIANERMVERWLGRLELSALQQRKPNETLEAIKHAIINCLEGFDDLRYDVQLGLLVRKPNGQYLPTRMLSDGQRNILSVTADIAYRCSLLNPELRTEATKETPGVVLIDELDLHLHPKWQRRIVDDLRRTFPKIQFIVTTHSPLIIQSLRPGELIDLNGGTPRDYFRQSVEEILTDEMGLDETRRNREYQEMMNVAEEYYALLERNGHWDPERSDFLQKRLEELTLPFHDNPAYPAYRNYLERKRLLAEGANS